MAFCHVGFFMYDDAMSVARASSPVLQWRRWAIARSHGGVLNSSGVTLPGRDKAPPEGGTFHYPHVRFASGAVRSYETFQECVDQFDFVRFAERFGWDHSAWDRRTVVQAYPDKVHVVVIFSRYNAADERLAKFDSLYIVTRIDNRWGIRSRSSFAP